MAELYKHRSVEFDSGTVSVVGFTYTMTAARRPCQREAEVDQYDRMGTQKRCLGTHIRERPNQQHLRVSKSIIDQYLDPVSKEERGKKTHTTQRT